MIHASPDSSLTRRDAIKLMGAGAALASLGVLPSSAAAQTPVVAATPQPFVLPKLGYAYDALEPHIDARTMEVHYTKHHAAYIANANKALSTYPELASLSGEAILADLTAIPEPIRQVVRNNVGGHVNHSFFWQILSPKGGGEPTGDLAAAIVRDLGSAEAMRTRVNEAALKRFGSGWAWLSLKGGALTVHSTANQDSPISEGAVPILGIDVWEHAYYLKHQNLRADYVAAFWSVVDWDQAGRNYAAAAQVQARA